MNAENFFIEFGLFAGVCFLFLWNSWQDKKINKLKNDLKLHEINTTKKIDRCLRDFIKYLGEITEHVNHGYAITDEEDESDDETIQLLEKLFTDAIQRQTNK